MLAVYVLIDGIPIVFAGKPNADLYVPSHSDWFWQPLYAAVVFTTDAALLLFLLTVHQYAETYLLGIKKQSGNGYNEDFISYVLATVSSWKYQYESGISTITFPSAPLKSAAVPSSFKSLLFGCK